MFCTKCGKEIENNAAICPHCGVPVEETAGKKTENRKRNPFSVAGFSIAIAANVFLGFCMNLATFAYVSVPIVVFWISIVIALVALGLSIAGLLTGRTHGTRGKWFAIVGICLSVGLPLISFVTLAVGAIFRGLAALYESIFF